MYKKFKCKIQNYKTTSKTLIENVFDLDFFNKHQKHDPWKNNLMSVLFLKFKNCALQNISLREWKEKPQSGKKVFANTHVRKDYYPKHTRTFKTQQ